MTQRESNSPDRKRGRKPMAAGCLGLTLLFVLAFVGYVVWSNRLPPPEPDARVYPNPNGYDEVLTAATQLRPADAQSPIN